MEPPNRLIWLFYSILGISGDPFDVEIEESQSVPSLKVAIMAQNTHAFADVDVRQINLWKVSGNMFLYLVPFQLISLDSLMGRSLRIPLKRSSSNCRIIPTPISRHVQGNSALSRLFPMSFPMTIQRKGTFILS
jgi:hypothetical protein